MSRMKFSQWPKAEGESSTPNMSGCGTHGTNCHRCVGLCTIFGFAFAVNWILQTKSFIRIMITYRPIQGLVNLSDSAFLNTAEYIHTDSATSNRFALASTSYRRFILKLDVLTTSRANS